MSDIKKKRSRCPNGTRKNSKTGNCEEIKSKKTNKVSKELTKQKKQHVVHTKENKKIKNVETVLISKDAEINKLKEIIKIKDQEIKELKKKLLSHVRSDTAKKGYAEEDNVCKDLNENFKLRQMFTPFLGNDYDECVRVEGTHKSDIQSKNKLVKAQVKKYKINQFQQLDRHWLYNLTNYVPDLKEHSQILKDLFEYPLLPNKTHVDKSIPLKTLILTNYSQETLDNLFITLNKNKRNILNYAFLGTTIKIQPDFLFGVEYVNDQRSKIVLFKIKDIIDYLEKLDFKISPRKTAILLGNDSIFSIQRKGGDSGKKSSNQIQIKLILSKLLNKVPNLEYKL